MRDIKFIMELLPLLAVLGVCLWAICEDAIQIVGKKLFFRVLFIVIGMCLWIVFWILI